MRKTVAAVVLCIAGAVAPEPKGVQATDLHLDVDSAQYHVRYADPMYSVTIHFTFHNTGRASVSSNYCRTPPAPMLEKRVEDGRWVLAYSAVELMCKSTPAFRIAAGATYSQTFHMEAARPGVHMAPYLHVDSIPGTYRLRWELVLGDDPDRGRPVVEIQSAPFLLIGPSTHPH